MAAAPNESVGPQVVRGMLAISRAGGGMMNIKLEPESLGVMRIQMNLIQGRMMVRFQADSSEARQLLSRSIETLRQSLESQGVKMDRVSIEPLTRQAAGPQNSTGQDHSSNSNDSARREAGARQDASDGRSRGFAHDADRRHSRERDPERRGVSGFEDEMNEQQRAATNEPVSGRASI